MKVLGITMSTPLYHEKNIISNTYGFGHDSAAALVDDGIILSVIEEERLNRIKHTNKSPVNAMKFCLEANNLSIKDIDIIAVNFNEDFIDAVLREFNIIDTSNELHSARFYVQRMLKESFGEDIADDRIKFVPHHIAHAQSVYWASGFDSALVLVIDGMGDGIAGILQTMKSGEDVVINNIAYNNSLGKYYLDVIKFLGYGMFDEYKVMGLAPYGDPIAYEATFKKMYKLLPNGQYSINSTNVSLLHNITSPRKRAIDLRTLI